MPEEKISIVQSVSDIHSIKRRDNRTMNNSRLMLHLVTADLDNFMAFLP